MIPVVITDPMEEVIPSLGLVTFEDIETGALCEFDTSGAEAGHYAAYVAGLRAAREASLRRLKMDFVNVHTEQAYVDALVEFFRARARRMQHA